METTSNIEPITIILAIIMFLSFLLFVANSIEFFFNEKQKKWIIGKIDDFTLWINDRKSFKYLTEKFFSLSHKKSMGILFSIAFVFWAFVNAFFIGIKAKELFVVEYLNENLIHGACHWKDILVYFTGIFIIIIFYEPKKKKYSENKIINHLINIKTLNIIGSLFFLYSILYSSFLLKSIFNYWKNGTYCFSCNSPFGQLNLKNEIYLIFDNLKELFDIIPWMILSLFTFLLFTITSIIVALPILLFILLLLTYPLKIVSWLFWKVTQYKEGYLKGFAVFLGIVIFPIVTFLTFRYKYF